MSEHSLKKLFINNPWANAPIFYKAKSVSTMEDALCLYTQGYPVGTVVTAGYQERGRGRFPDRIWDSSPNKNLLFTLMLNRDLTFPVQRVPVLIGLALSLAVEKCFKVRTEVKWPNDLIYKEKKLAGILCEAPGVALSGRTDTKVLLVGVGLNCNQERFSGKFADRTCSLKQILKVEVDTNQIFENILLAIHRSIRDRNWKEKLNNRLYRRGKSITVNRGSQTVQEIKGVLHGLSDDGSLLLRCKGRIISIISGEIKCE